MPRRKSPPDPFRWFDSSPEVIRLVVMLYVKYPLSLRNVEDLLHERGIDICHETVRLGVSTAIVWVRRSRLNGERSARRQGQPKGSKLDGHRGYLLGLVEATSDIRLKEMQARLREEKGVAAGIGTLCRFFRGRTVLSVQRQLVSARTQLAQTRRGAIPRLSATQLGG